MRSGGRLVLWIIISLAVLQRIWLLHRFAFTHIGIDNALIQQVARDYGQGIFREPYLYGQNYNPMLEALLAAPFVRLGAAPWIALPIVTSLLTLLPFWSWAWWARRQNAVTAAVILAAMPLLLPVHWGLITAMPRGWVHGLALLALIPWMLHARNAWLRHFLIGFTLMLALMCNPNALPLVAAIALWLVLSKARDLSLWVAGASSLAIGYATHRAAQAWYAARPGTVVHPLLPSDMTFSVDLLREGITGINAHVMHMHPFDGLGWLAFALPAAIGAALIVRGDRKPGAAVLMSLIVLLLALGLPKVHEGCASVFFSQSRMMLGLPLILAGAAALLLRRIKPPRWAMIGLPGLLLAVGTVRLIGLEATVHQELEHQGCAWVREEPITEVRDLCARVKRAAQTSDARLVVPIRWPGIRDDHAWHFEAHLICYACEALDPDFPPTYGAGYDRRSWRREAHESQGAAGVLFVGGRWGAYLNPIEPGLTRQFFGDERLLLYTVRKETLIDTSLLKRRLDRLALSEFILESGADDDLGR